MNYNDFLICIDNSDYQAKNLTIGGKYRVFEKDTGNPYYIVTDDLIRRVAVPIHTFGTKQEYRDLVLSKIGI